ncbi:MAG: CCA-adding enzyme [Microgenomates group bacterium ADurb.Bin219]|nr:MAG: CCA-adding enzyme [Microgenomates group bacterium ADurb.Bin219]HNP89596.1 HD domain-containing protein [Candidatus Woesebacteria bacterium]
MRTILPVKNAQKIPPEVRMVFEKFTKAGYEIYLVGGGVRNILVNKIPINCDFTTNAHPEVIQTLFPDSFYDNRFGTVGLIVKRGKKEEKYEITTYRGERGYSDSRHPDQVFWGKSLEEDLQRREFTISAIVIGKKQKEEEFELIDLFGGLEDLKNKIVRAVGNPSERFAEDALRMLRAVRLASQLGFVIEDNTFRGIKENASLLNKISRERVREELFKILASDYPSEGITLLMTSGLLAYIIPELIKGYGMAQKGHHLYDVWNHSLLSLKYCPSKDPVVRLATLIHDIGKPVVVRGEGENRTFYNHEMAGARLAENLADRLKFSKTEKEKLTNLVRWHQFTCDERQTDSAIRRFIRNVGKENLQNMLDLRIGDRLGGGARETSWRLEKFKQRLIEVQKQPFSVSDLKIDGYDVMKILGLKPGKQVGQILNQIFEKVEKGEIKNQRSVLLKEVKTSSN